MLSEKIYALRRKNGLSQEQLAEKIGVSRQAISKWEGGLATPELEKLKALCACFQITMDELTETLPIDIAGGAKKEDGKAAPRRTDESRSGIGLCIIGAVCLILSGIVTVICPSFAHQIMDSSVITLNGMGILIALFVLLMILGIILIFKKN